MPLYALVANLLVAPLLAPLTLLAMLSALLVLVGPPAVLPLLLWPVHQLAGLVITMASWISHWPGAQLLTGRPQEWVIALFAHGLLQLGDGLVAVEQFGRHWLLARHRGRAALVSTHGDARSCRMAKRLAAVHGHARLDWVMLLDPVATEVMACWQALAHRVEAPSKAKLPSPSARCFGVMAYRCSTSSIALEHC